MHRYHYQLGYFEDNFWQQSFRLELNLIYLYYSFIVSFKIKNVFDIKSDYISKYAISIYHFHQPVNVISFIIHNPHGS